MESEATAAKSRPKARWIILGGCLAVVACAVCVTVAAVGILYYFAMQEESRTVAEVEQVATLSPNTVPANTPVMTRPNLPENTPALEAPPSSTPSATATLLPLLEVDPPAAIDQRTPVSLAFESLAQLMEATYPYQDYFETAIRLGGKELAARTIQAKAYDLNDSQVFQVNEDRVEAILKAATDHVYMWVETGLDLDTLELASAAERLETDYYPRLSALFGQEWQPGVDNDPHFSVLHLVGSTTSDELGYFINTDEFPRSLYSESNEQEMIYLNMAQLELGSELYYGTLVHEIQHLIQWYMDPNETTWLNEGLSQLAEIYLGYDTVDTYEYQQHPETQLNAWDYNDNRVDAHYAAAYLYLVYLWEQLGEAAVQELSRHPANGMAAIASVLQGHQPDWTLEQFTADWIAANYLDDPAAGPRYYYQNLSVGPPSIEVRLQELPFDWVADLPQFGAHYIDLDIRGPVAISFAGDTVVDLFDASPRVGEKVWFAPGVDDTHVQLAREFDLTNVEQATLRFSTWYDLEEGYDFAYLSVSADEGTTWELLLPDHASAGEHGPAFNGLSSEEPDSVGGWLKESISLNPYVGRVITVRFEVLTDYETDSDGLGRGFAIDDISIPEIAYSADVETGSGGWRADGFVQSGWQLPQHWAIQLIEGGPTPVVTTLDLNHMNQGRWELNIGKGGGVLAVVPLTPFIDEQATYWLNIEQR